MATASTAGPTTKSGAAAGCQVQETWPLEGHSVAALVDLIIFHLLELEQIKATTAQPTA